MTEEAILWGIAPFFGRSNFHKKPVCTAANHVSFQPKIFKKQKQARKLHVAATQKTQQRAATIREG
jgi:hypothetical protein